MRSHASSLKVTALVAWFAFLMLVAGDLSPLLAQLDTRRVCVVCEIPPGAEHPRDHAPSLPPEFAPPFQAGCRCSLEIKLCRKELPIKDKPVRMELRVHATIRGKGNDCFPAITIVNITVVDIQGNLISVHRTFHMQPKKGNVHSYDFPVPFRVLPSYDLILITAHVVSKGCISALQTCTTKVVHR